MVNVETLDYERGSMPLHLRHLCGQDFTTILEEFAENHTNWLRSSLL